MRISTSYMQQLSVDAMLTRQNELAITQKQVSSGRRIISPSDDPVAAVKILNYEREKSVNEQYQENANIADSKMSLAEAALSKVTDLIQRIRELAVQALNDTNDTKSRSGIAQEMEQLNEALLSAANTADSNGEYLFSGYQSFTQTFDPATYAYGGDSGQRSIRVGSDYLVEVTEPGDQIFVITNVDGATQSIFQTVDEFVTALRNDTIHTAPNDKDFLTNLSTTLDAVLSARTRLGGRQNGVEQQKAINEASLASFETTLSELQDLDYAESVSLLNAQKISLQAAQQAYVKVQGLSLFNFL